MILCRDNGLIESYYNITGGKLGEFMFDNACETGRPLEYIFCEGCKKVVFELKVTKEWVQKY